MPPDWFLTAAGEWPAPDPRVAPDVHPMDLPDLTELEPTEGAQAA